MLFRQAFNLVLAVFLLTAATNAFTQSLDSCMEANDADAVKLCSALVQTGKAPPEAYHKLASSLYLGGATNDALARIDEGLVKHTNNNLLLSLRDNIRSGDDEQRRLREAARGNENKRELGRLKISCLTRNSLEGLTACRNYQSLGGAMEARISNRIASLEATFTSPTNPTNTVPTEPALPEVATADTADTSDVADTISSSPQKPVSLEVVASIQSSLNELGFPAGIPDGIVGTRTREALEQFQDAMRLPRQTRFDGQTRDQILAARIALQNANLLMRQSRDLADQENYESALELYRSAVEKSPLFQPPAAYEASLQAKLTSNQQDAARLAEEEQLKREREAERQRQATINDAEAEQKRQEEIQRQAALRKEEADRKQQLEQEQQEQQLTSEEQPTTTDSNETANRITGLYDNIGRLERQLDDLEQLMQLQLLRMRAKGNELDFNSGR